MFKDYDLKEFILTVLNKLKFQNPTDVQKRVIPYLLKNKNIIVQSNTGTGKTLSYLIPLLNKMDFSINQTQSIIFLPTIELANQIHKLSKEFIKINPNIRVKKIIGGNYLNAQLNNKNLPHLIICTPSKLKNFFDSGNLKLNYIKNIVFDEVDMIYDLGFFNEIDYLISKINKINNINFSAFSATVFKEIENFFSKFFNDTHFINLVDNTNKTNNNIEHFIVQTKNKEINDILVSLLNNFSPYICMIFVNNKENVIPIYNLLLKYNYKVCKISSEMSARQRNQIIKKIHNLEYTHIVCTDLMARGIDIDGVSHIISIEVPIDINYYVHRSGRTGRQNYTGYSYILENSNNLNKINKLKKIGINFRYLSLNNNNDFIEKDTPLFKKTKKYNSKNKNLEFKKRMIFAKHSKIKPRYKLKRNKTLKKLIK